MATHCYDVAWAREASSDCVHTDEDELGASGVVLVDLLGHHAVPDVEQLEKELVNLDKAVAIAIRRRNEVGLGALCMQLERQLRMSMRGAALAWAQHAGDA